MKKLLILALALVTLTGTQLALADSTANIKIHITGVQKDNSYFLCMQNIGCLSVLASDEGKTYTIYHPIEMDTIFITDVDHNFRVSAEGLPQSCQGTVQPNHTVTISGNASPRADGTVKINNLHCSMS